MWIRGNQPVELRGLETNKELFDPLAVACDEQAMDIFVVVKNSIECIQTVMSCVPSSIAFMNAQEMQQTGELE